MRARLTEKRSPAARCRHTCPIKQTLNSRRVENRMMEGSSTQLVVAEVRIRDYNVQVGLPVYFYAGAEKINPMFIFLVAGRWCLVLSLFCQLLFQAALTIAVHHGLVAVLAEVLCYIVFIGIVFGHYYHLAKGL